LSRFYWSLIIFLFLAGVCVFLFSGAARTVVILFLLIAYLIVFSLGVAVIRLNFFCRAVCRGNSGEMKTSLTFDDGPDPETTPAVLSVLAKHEIKAAFFCIGEKVSQTPDLARRIVAEGHIIANHTFHHFWWMNFLRCKRLRQEMAEAQDKIRNSTGKTPAFFRPPAGLTNPHLGRALRQNGLSCIGWDVRTFDTRRNNAQVVKSITRKTRDGSVILLHDAGKTSQDMKELLEAVITALKDGGFTFAALDNLLELDPYQENKEASDVNDSCGMLKRLTKWLAQTRFMKKTLADEITLDVIKQRPSVKFIAGISLVGISYIIGWPAVAFFTFLAAYYNIKEIAFLGPASYLFSHLVFIAGAALAGVDGIKYGHMFYRWFMHKFAVWVKTKALPDRDKSIEARKNDGKLMFP